MRITLDSNVYRPIINPDHVDFINQSDIKKYQIINKNIKNGTIEAYLSETIFTLEGISRKNRKLFFGEYEFNKSFFYP